MPVVDFAKTNREILVGTFEGVCTEIKFGMSKAANEPKFDFTFTLTEPEVEGRKVWRSASLQEQALWGTKEICIALGYDAQALSGKVDTDDIIAECTGKSCRLVLSEGIYNGKPSQSVDKVLSLYDVI